MTTNKVLTLSECLTSLKPRPLAAYKQLFGHVVVVGSDYGMGGACRLAGEAALRTGAGLVSVATRAEHAYAMLASRPELMALGIDQASKLDLLLDKASVVVLGPGIGQQSWGLSLINRVLQENLPMVVDADALYPNLLKPVMGKDWVLTPHPGEAARLLESSVAEVQQNREQAIRALQAQYQGTIVLKGANTLILGKQGEIRQCTSGNPGMATAGMGDVLAGIIAGLIAQGLSMDEAANLGVVMHATIGDSLAKVHGQRGFLASDLLLGIPQCLQQSKA